MCFNVYVKYSAKCTSVFMINTEVHYFGYLYEYITDLINAWKM